jgi:hypothetical protein
MASQSSPPLKIDRYVVIHVATTCDEHGVYVTKDSAEVIELAWILLDANNLEEVSCLFQRVLDPETSPRPLFVSMYFCTFLTPSPTYSCTARVFL